MTSKAVLSLAWQHSYQLSTRPHVLMKDTSVQRTCLVTMSSLQRATGKQVRQRTCLSENQAFDSNHHLPAESWNGADYILLASVTPLLQRFGPSACTQDAVQGAVHTLESASWISCWRCVAIRAE